jgi:O-antigen/teichoic acid export membrane protein
MSLIAESEVPAECEASALTTGIPVSSHGRTILRNFSSLGASAAFSRLAGLATNAVLARRVSPSGYGISGIAQSATLYFGLLSDLGLGTVAIREGAQHPEKLQGVISSMMGLRLVLASAASLVGLLVAPHLPFSESSRSLFRLFLLTLPIQALSVDWVFRAVQRMYWNTILEITGAALALLLTIVLVHVPRDVMRVAIIAMAAAAATAILGLLVLSRLGYHARPALSLAQAKYFLGQSLPLCAMWLGVLLYSQANSLILGAMRGETDVGLYGAAIRLSQVFYQPIWLFFGAMAPALMQKWSDSAEKARTLLSTSVRLTAIAGIGFGLMAASLGPWLIVKIFGKAFIGSTQAFEIMIWTGVILAIGHNWAELAIAAKKNRLLLQSTFLGAFVNLAVCAATVSRMGVRGAALSNLLAEIAVQVILIYSFGWHMGLQLLQRVTKPALAGAGAYAVAHITIWSTPILSAAVSALTFVLLLVFIGGITFRDVERLCELIPGRPIVPKRTIAPELES